MNCSMPGLPVHYQLPESTQTHVHWVGDAIQPSHPLSSPIFPSIRVFSNELFKIEASLYKFLNINGVLKFLIELLFQ